MARFTDAEFLRLSGLIDGAGHNGFHVTAIRRRRKNVPDWAFNDRLLRRVVTWRAVSREQMAHRAAVLYLYYRVGMGSDEISGYLSVTKSDIENLVHCAKKIALRVFS